MDLSHRSEPRAERGRRATRRVGVGPIESGMAETDPRPRHGVHAGADNVLPHNLEFGGFPLRRLRCRMSGVTSRRSFFSRVGTGIYGAALAHLLSRDLYGAEDARKGDHDLKPRPPHFPPKAKAVIHLFMNGGPSQMDLFDPK